MFQRGVKCLQHLDAFQMAAEDDVVQTRLLTFAAQLLAKSRIDVMRFLHFEWAVEDRLLDAWERYEHQRSAQVQLDEKRAATNLRHTAPRDQRFELLKRPHRSLRQIVAVEKRDPTHRAPGFVKQEFQYIVLPLRHVR